MLQKNKGFTLIEIIIAIFVIAILLTIGIVSYRLFEKETELEVAVQNIFTVLKLAQTKTLASEGSSQYGIHFESDKYVLFKGELYDSGAIDNEIHQMPDRLEIYDISLAGEGNDIVFERINGGTSQNGTISLRIINQPTKTKSVAVKSYGQIELGAEPAECCITNRLTDTRHLHLDLGWSIQNSAVLTLYSPDTPEASFDINMNDYFNAGKTEFDWSDTIEVNGQNQQLQIHTHFLDIINTTLCIHRDKDNNNKPLQILIDAKDIISYAADGDASIGFFGGILEQQ